MLNITATSATIYWETNESSDSTVKYSLQAGVYDLKAIDQQPVLVHQINLSGLKPASVYQFHALFSDPSGNQATSAPAYFKTLPLKDQKPPVNYPPAIQRRGGDFVGYDVSVPVTDDQGVTRVELYLDQKLVGVNYSANPGSNNYQFTLAPGALGLSHADFFNYPHNLDIKSFNIAGGATILHSPWIPTVESMDGELQIITPPADFTIYIPGEYTEWDEELPIQVYAVENAAELCPPPGIGGELECVHRTQAVNKVEFYINSVLIHTSLSTNPSQELHEYTWDAGGKPGRLSATGRSLHR